MKKISLLILIIAVLALSGCATTGNSVQQDSIQTEVNNLQEATLAIEGMTCVSCARGVEYELKQVEGVVSAKVSYKSGKGTVSYDASKVDAETIAQASSVYPATVLS